MPARLHEPDNSSVTQRQQEFLERTGKFWQARTSRPLTQEDARENNHNLLGFFKLLQPLEKRRRRFSADLRLRLVTSSWHTAAIGSSRAGEVAVKRSDTDVRLAAGAIKTIFALMGSGATRCASLSVSTSVCASDISFRVSSIGAHLMPSLERQASTHAACVGADSGRMRDRPSGLNVAVEAV